MALPSLNSKSQCPESQKQSTWAYPWNICLKDWNWLEEGGPIPNIWNSKETFLGFEEAPVTSLHADTYFHKFC